MSAAQHARARIATLAPPWLRSRRSVEVRVIVADLEEDRFVASKPETLARALRPIFAHLAGRPGRVEMLGVETARRPFGGDARRVPLGTDVDAAIRFLLDCR